MFMAKLVSLFKPFIILAYLCKNGSAQEIGERCLYEKTNEIGVCMVMSKCFIAVEELKDKGTRPQSCGGFVENEPVVCCIVKPGDLSRLMCAEYSKFVYKYVTPVTLLPGNRRIRKSTCHNAKTLIIGGKKAEPKEFPHMALIGGVRTSAENEIVWMCGGSLISEKFVLSAAHCIEEPGSGLRAKYIRLGELDFSKTDDAAKTRDFSISETIKHFDYKFSSHYNDIVLFKLNGTVRFDEFIRPACLYTLPKIFEKDGIITGWGNINEDLARSSHLLKAVVEFYDSQKCSVDYKALMGLRGLRSGFMDETQICAGSVNGTMDTCPGDSGGPIQVENKDRHCMYNIVGVTSFGLRCGSVTPSIYTKVYSYLSWIETNVWNNTYAPKKMQTFIRDEL